MEYKTSLKPTIIYVFRINDSSHHGCLKIGETSCDLDFNLGLSPNSKPLNEAARRRISQYTQTAGIEYELLYTELTLHIKDKAICSFNDKEVHSILERSGIQRKFFDETHKANEWFITDLATVKKAITAAKEGRDSLSASEVSIGHSPIVFRPEQRHAIDKTKRQFKTGNQMLWNAKMRFGKTLTALQLIKEMGFSRTLILTHRPVVSAGWFEDFQKIFFDQQNFYFGSKNNGLSIKNIDESAKNQRIKYIFFASMQDLRGSEKVGGIFDKNNEIFSTPWDFIIIDEAHEGIETSLGQAVLTALIRSTTKILRLSGTPFNLLQNYKDDQVYTWDYVMEQRAKRDWDQVHCGDPNPYSGLPTLNIFTYNLGDLYKQFSSESLAFNFKEFFRVDTSGTFFRTNSVLSFLNLLTKPDPTNLYPFSNEKYREIFRHTLWVLPGVKEAHALRLLLQNHPVFQHFTIINVAGDGDEENSDALKAVQSAIGPHPEDTRTITLTCGRLTTGVSVPAWTAVLMLSGSYMTSASSYMQTIFRVQTPAKIQGKIKEECYVFDFAPDRTLKVLAESAKIAARYNCNDSNDKNNLGEFLNFCPVISIRGSKMEKFDASRMIEELKKAYIERVVRNGFEDNKLYNNKLLTLNDVELKKFDALKAILKKSKTSPKIGNIDINNQGLNEEERKEVEKLSKKKKAELTEEEKKKLEEFRAIRKNREIAISILRGISIRMPLLIFGAELEDGDEITIDNFSNMVDDSSWREFMPDGVTKSMFDSVKEYYDPDIFRAAGRQIRSLARSADKLGVEERIEVITDLFSTFKNPDKETVLTPWKIVNKHMSLTLGGYTFYDENSKPTANPEHKIEIKNLTNQIFDSRQRVLEINSKSGLYPLYLTYNFCRARKDLIDKTMSIAEQQQLWDQSVAENIYVVCKTPMAKAITKRTLVGFRKSKVNARYFDDLVNQIRNKKSNFYDKIRKDFNLRTRKDDEMNFTAVVGNPPYQEVIAQKETTNGQKRSMAIFQHFQIASEHLGKYTSLIYPGARWIHRFGKGLDAFGKDQINDPHLSKLIFFPNANEIFTDVAIADGISIVLKDMTKDKCGFEYIYTEGGETISTMAECPGDELFTLDPRDTIIVHQLHEAIQKYACLHDSILSQKLFAIESDFVEKNPSLVRLYNEGDHFDPSSEIKLFTNDKSGKSGRTRWYITNKSTITAGLPGRSQIYP